MNFWDALDTTFGGYLPGGPTPEQVAYKDTFLAPITGGALAIAETPLIVVGGLAVAPFSDDYDLGDIWTGIANTYRLGAGEYNGIPQNFTVPDAFHTVLTGWIPDAIYDTPSREEFQQPGNQGGTSPILDKLKEYALPLLVFLGFHCLPRAELARSHNRSITISRMLPI